MLMPIPYSRMITPVIHSFSFPYSPDDGQALQMEWQRDNIAVKMKLPQTKKPVKRSDWQWHHITLSIPVKLCNESISLVVNSIGPLYVLFSYKED